MREGRIGGEWEVREWVRGGGGRSVQYDSGKQAEERVALIADTLTLIQTCVCVQLAGELS